MDIIFLGTGGAWGLPELSCDCLTCREMRKTGEKRRRTSFLLSGETTLLVDCGPDVRAQLMRHRVQMIDAVLISHEHGDHYLGLDELFAYKRNSPRGSFQGIPVYLTRKGWETIGQRFAYLEGMDVIIHKEIEPGKWFSNREFEILPFKTDHGDFAKGSVGFLIKFKNLKDEGIRLLYTSDFMGLPDLPSELLQPDYLIIQSYWFNEPLNNRPHHMSFQRAIHFIKLFRPQKETFLVHIGDADMVKGDTANNTTKKYEPKDPLRPHAGAEPYPIPLNQAQWQDTVDQIASDMGLPYKITVSYDGLRLKV